MNPQPICRVMKLGGSLLKMPNIAERVQTWLDTQPAARTLMLVGGGEIVEAVRELDRIHSFDSRWSHWLCVELLQHTMDLARQLFSESKCIENEEELLQWKHGDSQTAVLAIVKVSAFYARAKSNVDLPEGWETTSDSLAAHLTKLVSADELVLLKSAGEDEIQSTQEAFEAWRTAGLVDDAFPAIAVGLPRVRLVNLRAT